MFFVFQAYVSACLPACLSVCLRLSVCLCLCLCLCVCVCVHVCVLYRYDPPPSLTPTTYEYSSVCVRELDDQGLGSDFSKVRALSHYITAPVNV